MPVSWRCRVSERDHRPRASQRSGEIADFDDAVARDLAAGKARDAAFDRLVEIAFHEQASVSRFAQAEGGDDLVARRRRREEVRHQGDGDARRDPSGTWPG